MARERTDPGPTPGTEDADWEAEGGALPDGPQTEHPISPADDEARPSA